MLLSRMRPTSRAPEAPALGGETKCAAARRRASYSGARQANPGARRGKRAEMKPRKNPRQKTRKQAKRAVETYWKEYATRKTK
jgi:hypothetical protein